ncbi:MAG: hypothetical protein MZV63_67655 [Marinilabiliales bacterium]|nr:hypothetical protein [Marinilabiliales bacterium]
MASHSGRYLLHRVAADTLYTYGVRHPECRSVYRSGTGWRLWPPPERLL